MTITFDRERTAVLIMDDQNDILLRFTQIDDATLERAAAVLAAARAAGVPVIYVKIAFRPGYPEVPDGSHVLRFGVNSCTHSTDASVSYPSCSTTPRSVMSSHSSTAST
jgi:nicotinamidase-related amidase